jgi:hypothetical protein
MSDIERNPIGLPLDDDDSAREGEVTEEDYEEVEGMDEELTDDPAYDPATQAPKEAER